MIAAAPGATVSFEAIGTRWSIATGRPLTPATRRRVDATIEDYDRTWSRFRPDSAVAELARTGGPVDLGPHAPALLELLTALAVLTDGGLSPLVGGSLEHLGYGPGYPLEPGTGFRPAPPLTALQVDGTRVRLAEAAVLDVGSAGKGQLVDLVAAVLDDAGHDEYVVDAGGDLRAAGPPVRVALEHPFDPSSAVGTVVLTDAAIAGSAPNRRAWTGPDGRRLHHVLDGRTGAPIDTVAATWVVAATAMLADALATALFLAEPADLEGAFAFRFVRMATDGRAHWSPDLPGEVFR